MPTQTFNVYIKDDLYPIFLEKKEIIISKVKNPISSY